MTWGNRGIRYKLFDQSLAWQRYRAAVAHADRNSRVSDIGCGLEASLLYRARNRFAWEVGLDYQLNPQRCERRAVWFTEYHHQTFQFGLNNLMASHKPR